MAKKIKNAKITTEHKKEIGGNGCRFYKIVYLAIAIAVGILHRYHLASLFENDRHFSHLSDLEREMTFRTEMGLYYSYYKTIIKAPSFLQGLTSITRDNVTEFPHEINTLKRFNLYPEVILAFFYRQFKSLAKSMNWRIEQCYQTNRGNNLPPIVSCEGIGNPFYFYVNASFAIAGTVASSLFLYGLLLSGSLFGGIISVSMFMFNHGEATRVQWTPSLRESFAYPIFMAIILTVTYMIRERKTCWYFIILIAKLTGWYMLCWQFAQFSLSCVVGSLFATYLLGFLEKPVVTAITKGFLIGFIGAFIFLFGNEMLLISLFLSSIISLLIVLSLESVLVRLRYQLFISIVQASLFLSLTLAIRIYIQQFLAIEDDAHIFDILRSKFDKSYSTFDTRLYTCAAEFDFQPYETYEKLYNTLLLPICMLLGLVTLLYMLKCAAWSILTSRSTFVVGMSTELSNGHVLFNFILAIVFTILAYIIMRLKLFWTPQLCAFAALLAKDELFELVNKRIKLPQRHAACCALLALSAFWGVKNLQQQWSIMGEYSNWPLEELFNWVEGNTPKDAVFAGTMPTMANLKLSTERPIIIHPHYEDVKLRSRVQAVYSMFSRKSPVEINSILKNLKADYVIFEYNWCRKNPKKDECSIIGSFDRLEPELIQQTPFCDIIKEHRDIRPFEIVFHNDIYTVMRV